MRYKEIGIHLRKNHYVCELCGCKNCYALIKCIETRDIFEICQSCFDNIETRIDKLNM